MIRVFCNKCGKELKFGDHRKVELTVRPYTTYGGRFNLDYCENCFKEIIGEEESVSYTHLDVYKRQA